MELLYVNDLVLVAETKKLLLEKLGRKKRYTSLTFTVTIPLFLPSKQDNLHMMNRALVMIFLFDGGK